MRHSRHHPRHASRILITAPDDEDVVTLAEAKAQLRVTSTSDDDLIQALIDSCVSNLDPATNGWLGRAIRPQTWELRLSAFPRHGAFSGHHGHAIELPFPPLISIVSFKYDDQAGIEQTLAVTTGYRIFGQAGLGRASLRPPYAASWPVAREDVEAVRIQFQCGYVSTPTDLMPKPIKQAVLLSVRMLYDIGARSAFQTGDVVFGVASKQFSVSDAAMQAVQRACDSLLMPYRVFE